MTYARSLAAVCRILLAAACGAILGGFLGLATAQEGCCANHFVSG